MDTILPKYDWSDVTSVRIDEGSNPLAPIIYSSSYRTAIEHLMALMATNEASERALHLTQFIIKENSGHYSVWLYRQNILTAQPKLYDKNKELHFINEMAEESPKSYQMWAYREWLTKKEGLDYAKEELIFLNQFIKEDSKNYHAWTYRQWIIKTFQLWENELEFINELLELDIRNNSAWNQRAFIQSFYNEKTEFLKLEFEYCIKKIEQAPHNESPWHYIENVCEQLADKDYADQLVEQCRRYTLDECFVPFAMSVLVIFSESMSLPLDKSWVDKPKESSIPLTFPKITTILQFLVDTSRLPIYVHCLDGTVVTCLVISCLRKLSCWSLPSILIEFSKSTSDNSPPSSDEVEFIEKFQTEMEIGRQSWVWPMMSEFKRHPTLKIKLEGEPVPPMSNMTSFTESIAGKLKREEDEEVFSLTLRALDLEMSFSKPSSAN